MPILHPSTLPQPRRFSVRAFFDAVALALKTRAEMARAVGGVIVFELEGPEGARFVVDLAHAEVRELSPSDPAPPSSAAMVASCKQFEQLIHGEVSIAQATASGAIAEGDARAFEALALVMQP